jgi:hypothetical protein
MTSGQSIVIQNNGGSSTTITNPATAFSFTKLANSATYAITVLTPPTGDTCTVTGGSNGNGSGTITSANVTGVVVACTPITYTVSGSVSGMTSGQSIVIQNNGGSNTTIANPATTFSFTKLANSATYAITVLTPPTGDTCTVTGGSNGNGSGTIAAANVTNIVVACSPAATYSIGGSVSGLNSTASVILADNGTDTVTVSSNTTFTFGTKLASGATYEVTVNTQPSGENCTVTGGSNGDGSGTVAAANVTNIAVACTASLGGGGGGGGAPWWMPFDVEAISGATPAGQNGLRLIPSDKLESNPPLTSITTTPTKVLGIGLKYTISNNVLTSYSPVLMAYYTTGTDGTTQIYGLTINNTSTTPTPLPIGTPIPSTQQICGFSSAPQDISDPTKGFAILKVGPSGASGCTSGPFTFETAKYTDSPTTPQAVVSLNSFPIGSLYTDNLLTGILFFDSSAGTLNLYSDITFTSPKHLLTGVQSVIPALPAIIKDSTPYGNTVEYLNVYFTNADIPEGVPAFYRLDETSGGTITKVFNNLASSVTLDSKNVYFIDESPASETDFYQAPTSGGSPTLIFKGKPTVLGSGAYSIIGSNDSLLVFEFSSTTTAIPPVTTSTIYTIPITNPVGTLVASATTIGGPYTGAVSGFLASPTAGDPSGDILFANVISVTEQIVNQQPVITYDFSSFSGSPGATLTATPLANSYYEPLAFLTDQASDSVLQIKGITDSSGTFGGGNYYQVDIGTLAATEFTTLGGGAYKIPAGYFGAFIGGESDNAAIGILLPEANPQGTAATPLIGLAGDLTKNFVLPVEITNTNVAEY